MTYTANISLPERRKEEPRANRHDIASHLPIIEVAEAVLLDELMLDKQVSAMVLTRLSGRVAVVDPSRYDTLIARLRKLGHLPKVEA